MRIFQTITATANYSVSNNSTWYRNLHEPLVEMGHDVVLFPADEGIQAMRQNSPRMYAAFSQKLCDTFNRAHSKKPFDLFFAYLMDGMVDPGAIDEIRKTGVPTCNFSCNNAHQFYLVDELSPHFDYNLHSERDVGEKFLAIGANPVWWPMASNPKYFKPYDVARTVPVSFVGGHYALRGRYIAHLLRNGVDVYAYGPGWVKRTDRFRAMAKRIKLLCKSAFALKAESQNRASAILADHDFRESLSTRYFQHMHLPVTDLELIELYSRSHISMGFLEVFDNHDPSAGVKQHLHLREFEAPMSGALYCTGYSDELSEMFEPDKEVLVYKNQHELLEKVTFYLEHPEEAERIRQAGYVRALSEHTYQQRFKNLFRVVGLEL